MITLILAGTALFVAVVALAFAWGALGVMDEKAHSHDDEDALDGETIATADLVAEYMDHMAEYHGIVWRAPR